MKYIGLIFVLMMSSCMSTKRVTPVAPLVIQPVAPQSATSLEHIDSVVSDQVNLSLPTTMFFIIMVLVFASCLLCWLVPKVVGQYRSKGRTDQASERVVLND